MNDEELTKLGVTRLGDRVVLRSVCKNMQSKLCVHVNLKLRSS